MLKSNLESKLLVAWSEKIRSEEANEALRYLVGYAACASNWTCHPQWKGFIPDFRFHGTKTAEQKISFVPAQQWLLIYFRKPAVTSGYYRWDKLVKIFQDAKQKSGEWQVRVRNLDEAKSLVAYIDGIGDEA